MTVGYGYGYGYGKPGGTRARMRASTVDREHAVALLKEAFTEGRLTKDEYDARVERALTARTYSDLDLLVLDLPVPPRPAAPVRSARTNPLAVASVACAVGEFFTGGLTALPAVVLGHMARHQIRRTGEDGGGLALTGLVLGWAAIIVTLLAFITFVASTGAVGHPVHIVVVPPAAPGG